MSAIQGFDLDGRPHCAVGHEHDLCWECLRGFRAASRSRRAALRTAAPAEFGGEVPPPPDLAARLRAARAPDPRLARLRVLMPVAEPPTAETSNPRLAAAVESVPSPSPDNLKALLVAARRGR